MIKETEYLFKRAVDLRRMVGERIFELEKDEMRSRHSGRSLLSRRTGHAHSSKQSTASQISMLKMRPWPS